MIEALSNAETVGGHSRMWWGFLACGLAVSGVIVAWTLWRSKRLTSAGGFMRHWLAPQFWRKTTAWVDLKVWGTLHVFDLFWGTFTAGALAIVSYQTASLLGGVYSVAAPGNMGWMSITAVTVLMLLADDFSRYFNHMLRHKVPVFWAFHRVHHSSERMTMISNSRLHPFDRLVQFACNLVLTAPLFGVIAWAFGGIDVWILFGANIGYSIKNVLIANLQHTHVRWRFTGIWARLFISPTVHQIHHSRLDHHWDMNYGETFAIWDWMFGTLYLPKKGEHISYGLSSEFGVKRPRPHQTLVQAMVEPFQFLRRKEAERLRSTTSDENSDERLQPQTS